MSVAVAEAVEPARADNALYSLIAAVGAGDLAGAVACFTRQGCLVTPDGTAVHGRRDIGPIVRQMIASRTEIEVEQLAVRRADDVALATGRMTVRSDGPEGARVAQACEPHATLQRVEGQWKVAILAPWARVAD